MTPPEGFKARMFRRARDKDTVVRAAEAVVDEWAHITPARFTPTEKTLIAAVGHYQQGRRT